MARGIGFRARRGEGSGWSGEEFSVGKLNSVWGGFSARGRRNRAIRGALGAATLTVAWGASWNDPSVLGEGPQVDEEIPQVNRDDWTSSAICGECHQAIHAVWSQSLHSKSWTNGVFQAAYQRTLDKYGTAEAKTCMNCHAPTVRFTKDYGAEKPITSEGITCDFCHSVNAIDLNDRSDPIRYEVGRNKYGPLRHAQSPAHNVVHSPLHKTSEFCAGCHEYKNAKGLTILGTYSEWKAGPYAQRGKQCQDCHMPLVPGRIVALEVGGEDLGMVNLHDISGYHDLEQIRKAVKLKLLSTDWIGNQVWVNLEVSNVGSGHCFPTGLPMHRAMLEVTLRGLEGEVGRREIPFHIVMVDERGRRIEREYELFHAAAKVTIDTRLKPAEVRPIELTFRDVDVSQVTLSAQLSYAYSTESLVIEAGVRQIEPVEMKVLVGSVQKTLKRFRR